MANDTTKRSRNRHSVAYWQHRPLWIEYLNLDEPLPGTLGQFLFRYPAEDKGEFAERLKRLAQINFVNAINDFYCSMLFSTNVQITSQKNKDEVQSFVTSCNQQGDSLLEFFREVVAPNAFLYGIVDVFVDLPQNSEQIITLEQQKASGVDKPYCYIVPPLNRVEWDLDAAKNYIYYRSEDVINTQVAAQMGIRDPKQDAEWTEQTEWREDRVIQSEKQEGREAKQIAERVNPFGFIPAVSVTPLPSKRFYSDRLGLSLIKDVAPLQKLVLNLISLMMDHHESANFAQRVIVQDTDNGDIPPDEGEIKESGPKRGTVLYGKGSKYEIVSPDGAGVESMRQWLCELIERIYQQVDIPSDSNLNKTHQTGATIRSNQAQLFNRLSRISKHFEKALRQIVETSLKVRGIDPLEAQVSVQWDTNFAYEALDNAIEQLSALREAVGDMSATAVEEFAKKVLAPALYNSGKMDTIEKELDAFKRVEKPTKQGKPKADAPVSSTADQEIEPTP